MTERKVKSTIFTMVIFCAMLPAIGDAQESRFLLGMNIGATETDDRAQTEFRDIPDRTVSFDNFPLAAKGTTWSVFAGYELTPRLDVEVSYADLAELQPRFGRESLRLEPDELAIRLRYTVPLYRDLSLNVLAGVSYADFSTSGSYSRPDPCIPSPPGAGGPPCPGPDVTVTAAEPEAETGNLWGLGLDWKLGEKASLDLQYTSHDVKVLNISQYSLGVRWRL